MAYSTLADLKKQISEEELIQYTDDFGLGTVQESVVTQAIADADAVIDSYLAERYTVPLSPVPPLILKYSVDIAIWELASRKPGKFENIEKRHNAVLKALMAIAKGTVSLGVSTLGGTNQIKTSRTKTDRTFTIGSTSNGTIGTLDNY